MLNEAIKILCLFIICYAWDLSITDPSGGKGKQEEKRFYQRNWVEKINGFFFMGGFMVKGPFWAFGIAEVLAIVRGQPSSIATIMNPRTTLGFLLAFGGGLLRKKCYDTMGDNFTFRTAIRENHTLITHGPYSIVRHPSYSAGILLQLGVWIWHTSPGSWMMTSIFKRGNWVLPIFALFFAVFMSSLLMVAIFRRIPAEERILKAHFGKEWEDYVRRVPYRIFPGVF